LPKAIKNKHLSLMKINNMKTKLILFILSSLLVVVSACKKEETTVSGTTQTCTLNKITYWNGMLPVDVVTDSSGNITKYYVYDLIKSGDSVLFKFLNQGTVWYILYDNLKRPIKYESKEGFLYELTYNNTKEQPSRIFYKSPNDSIGLVMQLTYTNNNISQIKWIDDTDELNLNVDYYLSKTNKLANKLKLLVPGWKMDTQIPYNFALMFSANLPKSITLIGSNEGLYYKYDFDNNNNISKEKLIFGNSDTLVTSYGYTCR
jgi:hypothetical protein